MPAIVQFGAGNIGRGFIVPLFNASGWSASFVDVDERRIAALQERGRYTVTLATSDGRDDQIVAPVTGLLADDRSAIAAAIAQADLLATAVGLGALKFLGPNIAAGLVARWQDGERPLDILVCENGIQATQLLHGAILDHLPTELHAQAAQSLGLVRSSIGRMIPPGDADADLLDILVEPYAKLPLEAEAFRGPAPANVTGVKLVNDFELILRQKLYLHNMSHACCAYSGQRRGYTDLPTCVADAELVASVRAASDEVIEALARAHGGDASSRADIRTACQALIEDLLQRYGNTALADPVGRVARDPVRKLAGDDRLIGAARLCLSQGVQPRALAHHILAACAYRPAADEPQIERFLDLQEQGWSILLRDIAQLTEEEPLMATLDIAARQQEAADLIEKSGIYLKQEEIAEIEIADFGLGRYDELGLAIYVYVNTDRCCAKELAMVPGQICPEHRHPHLGDEPGKEETFRVRSGQVHMFLPGGKNDPEAVAFAHSLLPADKRDSVTIYKHVLLEKGDQLTLAPNTPHWFAAGKDGAVVSEFSTKSRDEADIFTDNEIQRVPDDGPHNG